MKLKLNSLFYPFVFAVIFAVALSAPRLIRITSIECKSQFGPCSKNLSDALATGKGKSLSTAKAQITLHLKNEASVKDFSVRFKLPPALAVTVVEKKARFALFGERIYALLDEEGEVLSESPETALPFIVIFARPPNLGEKVDEKTLFALKIQERLYSAYQVREGNLEADHFKALLPNGYTALFPLVGDNDRLMGALALIIYELNKPGQDSRIKTTVTTIDLRFANPVLR